MLFLAPLIASSRSVQESCNDSGLRDQLKTELDFPSIKKKCAQSNSAFYGSTSVPDSNGNAVETSACEAIRLEMFRAASDHLSKKRRTCLQAKEADQATCENSEHCLKNFIRQSEKQLEAWAQLSDDADRASRSGESYLRDSRAVSSRVERDLKEIEGSLASLPLQDQRKIRDAGSIGARR